MCRYRTLGERCVMAHTGRSVGALAWFLFICHPVCRPGHNRLMSNGFTVNALTMRVRRTLLDAWEEAERLGHSYVGTEHLLFALTRDPDGIAGQVLDHLGIADRVAEELERILTSPSYGGSHGSPSQPGALPGQGTPEATVWFESDVDGNPRLRAAG